MVGARRVLVVVLLAVTACGGGNDRLPEGGEQLSFGEPTELTHADDDGDEVRLRVSVLDAREPDPEEFAALFDLDEEEQALRPYYVDVRVEHLGGAPLPRWGPATYMLVENSEGRAVGPRLVFGRGSQGEDCESERTDGEGSGFTITTCDIYLVDGQLASVAWLGRHRERDEPIRWLP